MVGMLDTTEVEFMKKLDLLRRAFLGLGIASALCTPAYSQEFPNRPIRLLVGFSPGASTDAIARALAEEMGRSLGQNVIVENRVGANGNLATTELAKANADGHTLLFTLSPHVTNALVYRNASFDLFKDFAYVSEVARIPVVLIANPKFPANNMREMISIAKSDPKNPLQYGSPGVGSTYALAMDLLGSRMGFKSTPIHYKGNAPALVDLIAGRIPAMFAALQLAKPYIDDGRVKVLGVATDKRIDLMPRVPAINESVPGFEVDLWFGVVAPGATPPAVMKKLNEAVVRAVQSPKIASWLQQQGTIPVGSSSQDFAARIKREHAVWSEVIRDTGLKIDQ